MVVNAEVDIDVVFHAGVIDNIVVGNIDVGTAVTLLVWLLLFLLLLRCCLISEYIYIFFAILPSISLLLLRCCSMINEYIFLPSFLQYVCCCCCFYCVVVVLSMSIFLASILQ